MPLGVAEAEISLPQIRKTPPDFWDEDAVNGKKSYSLDDYPQMQDDLRELFEQLRRRILNLDVTVREEYKKLYIAYKLATNFVDVEPQKKRLQLTLNIPFDAINDPKGLCRDVTNVGHWGNGNVEFSILSTDQLDDAMDLIRQSFARHWEESEMGVV